MSKKFATDVLEGKKFLLKSKDVKRVKNPPNYKEFAVSNI